MGEHGGHPNEEDVDAEEVLPEPPDECPDCGESGWNVRKRVNGDIFGYGCSTDGCSYAEYYCLEPLDSGGYCSRVVVSGDTIGEKSYQSCWQHEDTQDDETEDSSETNPDADAGEPRAADILPDPGECGQCGSSDWVPQKGSMQSVAEAWLCQECHNSQMYCMAAPDGDYCHRRVSELGETCYMHPQDGDSDDPEDVDVDVPKDHGAPAGNDHAEGNPGGAPPEGNVNAMKHGLHMSAERLLEVMDERQREIFKQRFVEYQQDMMNDSQALHLAAAAVMREELMIDLFEDGFQREVYTDDGKPFDQFKKDDVQALQGFFRELRLGLHYEGNSAQHQGSGGGSGHSNLDKLVNDVE